MRRWWVGVAAAVAVVAMAAPASAAPTNAKNALVFDPVVCTGLRGQQATLVLAFTVNGGGRGVAHTSDGRIFQPLALDVTVNGEPEQSYVKNNAERKSDYSCTGETTVEGPFGSATIAFTALGSFKP